MNIKNNRWVLFRHEGAPDDLKGVHFDLLLEDVNICRTWRLTEIPQYDGPLVEALAIAPHRIEWLEIDQALVSRGRGFVRRVAGGSFQGEIPFKKDSLIQLVVSWNNKCGFLVIKDNTCGISSKDHKHCR